MFSSEQINGCDKKCESSGWYSIHKFLLYNLSLLEKILVMSEMWLKKKGAV